jgi:hypothetical protein
VFRQLLATFKSLFTTAGAKTAVVAMILLIALVPVAELMVIRMFSHLITTGQKIYAEDPSKVYKQAVLFFVLFAVTRAVHHWSRFARVIAVRYAFRVSAGNSQASRAAWEWALAFELSIVTVALVQATLLTVLFIFLDGLVGVVNAVIVILVMAVISVLYTRNLNKQIGYVTSGTPTSTEVGDRVRQRLRDAELGAALASFAMAFALAAVLLFTLRGRIGASDAIVMLLGMRLLYGQLSQLSGGAMRFGRASARRGIGGDEGIDDEDDLEERPSEPAAFSDTKRADLVNRMLTAGQRGEHEGVRDVATLLHRDGRPSDAELNAQHAAEAFARYAQATALLWQIRPFPGMATDWINPLLLKHVSGNPVSYASPPADFPHLVMHGRVARHVTGSSIVVGLGALPDDVLDPNATYVSVRGPRTAERATGSTVTRYGDPLVLAARSLPVRRKETNGRLALVRHYEHTKFAVTTGDRIDELSPFASRPDAIRAFVSDLVGYDGVVTSSLAVMALCQSFGVPCAPVAFGEPSPVQAFAYEDHALGLDLPVVLPTQVTTDLRATDFDDLLTTVTIAPSVLDDIEDAIKDAVATYTERYDELSEAFDDEEVDA